jgi:hypothetical protein
MLGNICQPNILFLRGCFLSDCKTIEDLFDARLMVGECNRNNFEEFKELDYDKIPKIFTGTEDWVKQTNLKCWYCDLNFHNIPIFIPTSLEDSDKSNSICGNMDVMGNFCSWNCATGYINTYYTSDTKWEYHELLKLLYKIFTGNIVEDIIESPPKTKMVQYGGNMTKLEYTEEISKSITKNNMSISHSKIEFMSKI